MSKKKIINRAYSILLLLFVSTLMKNISSGKINLDDALNQAAGIISGETDQNKTAGQGASVVPGDYSNTGADIYGISVPDYDGQNIAYILNNNEPFFISEFDLATTETYVKFSDLDIYERQGQVNAVVGPETLADEERGDISIYPSGWWEAKQTDVNVNRCHLLAFCLAGNQTNVRENLIVGSRAMNAGASGYNGSMLDYELMTVKYIEETGNHVRYRVTPVFENVDVTAKGVLMEAESIEDQGEGLKFCVWIHNVQPEYTCDYTTGVWEHN